MANQRISELTALLGADVAALDVLPIVDISATSTKKITAPELKAYLLGGAVSVTAAGRALLDDADATAQRTTLGLGTMSVETAADYLTLVAAAAGYQPLDSDLTAIAALTTTSYGRALLALANASALRTAAGLVIGTDVQAFSSVLQNTTASFLTAQETKLGHISVTQAVDLDAIETRVNGLDAAVVLKGTWDASAGTFPGSGTAQAGDSYIVSVAGTVGGVAFVANDRILAITDNASTSTYAANWHKLDYTDAVLSVAGRTGAVTLALADLTDASANGRSLVGAADYAAMRALLDLEAGTDFYSKSAADLAFQPLDSDLTAIAALSTTSFGRGLLTLTAGTDTYVLTMSGGVATWAAASGGGGTPGGSGGDIQYNSGGSFAGSLLKQGSNLIEQRNGSNSQTHSVYHNYTDVSNYSRISYYTSGGYAYLDATGLGTGLNDHYGIALKFSGYPGQNGPHTLYVEGVSGSYQAIKLRGDSRVSSLAIDSGIALSIGGTSSANFSNLSIGSNGIHWRAGDPQGDVTIGGSTRSTDSACNAIIIQGYTAISSAVTNITGGPVKITAGDGASASSGNAHGGNVELTPGDGAGTGHDGYIILNRLPASSAGLPTGALWNDGGSIKIAA